MTATTIRWTQASPEIGRGASYECRPDDNTHIHYVPHTGRVDITTRDGDYLTSRVWNDTVPYDGCCGLTRGTVSYSECAGRTTDRDPENGSVWGTPFGLGWWAHSDHVADRDEWPEMPAEVVAIIAAFAPPEPNDDY